MFRFLLTLFFINLSFAQQIDKVDFIKCDAFLSPNASTKSIFGKIIYEFKVIKPIDTIKIDAINMEFENVSINHKEVKFVNNKKQLLLFEGFKKGKNVLIFNFVATPKQTLYFNGENEDLQIWTQGQGKYTSHWLPSFDDVNEKVIFNLSVAFREQYDFILNGNYIKSILTETSNIKYFQMKKPMSSYLVMLAIGNFVKKEDKSKSGTPLEFYLDAKDSDKFEPTYKYSKEMFDYLEQEIGVKYPWEIYRQIPVRDFLYAGMENTTSTIFSQDFVVDEIGFNDKKYMNVNAHELAHQWFGNLVTAKEPKHHWLQEGFATYYALLAERSIFGEDYFQHQLYEIAKELKEASTYDTIPILNEKASSLSFYKKGAWALHVLKTNIGDKNFKKAVKNYLKKYQYKNATTDDFLKEVRKISSYDVEKFKQNWLESGELQHKEIFEILGKSEYVNQLIQVEQLREIPFEQKKQSLETILKSNANSVVKQEIVNQMIDIPMELKQDLILLALQTNDLKVRHAVIETTGKIPSELRTIYETLLKDESYITRELALLRLFQSFGNTETNYIEMSKNWEGLHYNLKLVHLLLSLLHDKKEATFLELVNYTKSPYEAVVREKALEMLVALNLVSDDVLLSLIDLSLHHKWQTVKFAKITIRQLITKENYKQQLENLKSKSTENQKNRIDYFLNE